MTSAASLCRHCRKAGLKLSDILNEILNGAPCGFISFVDDGTVTAINDTLLQLLGYSRQAIEGHHISLLLTVGSRIFYQTHLFPLLKMRGSVEEIYVSLLARNGDGLPVLLNARRQERDGVDVNDCIVMPMRQRDRYEEELLNARKTAEEAVRGKDRAYTALAETNKALEEVNSKLEAQAEELQTQQEQLLELNSRLHETAEREAHLREQSRHVAEQLQGALQPALPKDVSGLKLKAYYQAALAEASIGGDFYDVFSLQDNCYALVVADLSGKGLKAATQIATVRHMLRTLLYDPCVTLSQAITTVSSLLVKHELIEGFATVFVGVYDVNKRVMRYVNAGQEPGLLYRPGSGVIIRLNPTGPVLGGFPDATFAEQDVNLASGDVLALFTDGLTEAGVDRHRLLEIDGLEKIFVEGVRGGVHPSVDDIVIWTIAGVTDVVTPAGIRDDVCLLVARFD